MTEHNPQNPYSSSPWGHAPNNQYGTDSRQPVIQGSNGLATAGFVLALFGAVLFWVPFVGALLALIGTCMAFFGRRNAVRYFANRGKGLATAGLLIGLLGTLGGGTFSTGVTVVAVKATSSMLNMLHVHVGIQDYLEQNGELPYSIEDIGNYELTERARNSELKYEFDEEGNYTLRNDGFFGNILGSDFAKGSSSTFSSATMSVTGGMGNTIWGKEQVQELIKSLGSDCHYDCGPTPLDRPKSSKRAPDQPKSSQQALPEPKSADDAKTDF